jgi:hypothetical protein
MNIPTIAVSGTTLPYIEHDGIPVVTFTMIDTAHGRPSGTARKRFNDNKRHLVEGEDFYPIDSNRLSEIRTIYPGLFPEAMKRVTFFTETGYLMIVKSFTDDLAWQVQRQLVKSYFRVKGAMQPTTAPPVPEPIDHYQRDELYRTANLIFCGFGGRSQSASGWLYNRLRTKYHLKRIEDLSRDDYQEAMDILIAQKPKVAQYQALQHQLRDSFLRDVIGGGECWTAWLTKQTGGVHKVGQRPNWKAIAQQMLKRNGIQRTQH